ncbi:MAG: hypothetical protein ACREIC_07455, partial [Limisphaerales bacterium]
MNNKRDARLSQARAIPCLNALELAMLVFLCASGDLCRAADGRAGITDDTRRSAVPGNVAEALLSDPTNANPKLPVLTRLIQVRDLSPAEASRGYPVEVTGVITFEDESLYLHFIQDDSAGIYLDTAPATNKPSLHHGQRVQLSGFSGPGDYAPIIHTERIEVLGSAQLPPAKATSVRMLMTGTEDSQWVALKGVVRSMTSDTNRASLSLSTIDSAIDVVVPASAGPPPGASLVDAAVEVQGVCTTIFNDHRRLQGVTLYAPDWTQIEVKEAAPADPFTLPLRPI